MSETKIFSMPESGSGNSDLATLLALQNGNNGGLFGGNGLGGGILGFLIGMLFPQFFGRGGLFGGGNGFGANGAGTAYLGNMISNDNGRDLLMQAINNSGERSVSAIQQLATTIGQDFNLVNSGVQTISQLINTIAANQGVNALQIINAIQSGNASIASQFAQCCCQQQLAMANQTAALQQGINGVQQSIANKSAADQLATCQQTYTLTDGANRNTQAIISKLDQMQTQALQDKLDAARAENSRLAGEISQAQQNSVIAGMIGNAINPIAAQLAGIRSEVDAIKRCQPQTITLPNNSMTAVPTIWANAVADNIVDKISAALTPSTTTTTTPATVA